MDLDPNAFVEPSPVIPDPGRLLAEFLDCHRQTVQRKVAGLSEQEMRSSRLPSGWSPLELLRHLTFVERRWLRWGFLGEDVGEPWGDADPPHPDAPWRVPTSHTVAEVLAEYRAETDKARRVVDGRRLTDRAAAGGRFGGEDPRPTLGWILMHLLQEYARHVGHLDVVRELIDGGTGE